MLAAFVEEVEIAAMPTQLLASIDLLAPELVKLHVCDELPAHSAYLE